MAPTERQRQVLEALLHLIGKNENPTVRELGALVGLSAPATVLKHLRALEREGLVSLSGKSRGIRCLVSPEGSSADPEGGSASSKSARSKDAAAASGIPMVGLIAAGRPIESVALPAGPEEASAFPALPIDPQLFSGSGELLALKVAGDS